MHNVYARRREELCARLGAGAVAIIHGAGLARRNSDVEHRFRQPSDLLFLTGFEEPDAMAVLAPSRAQRFTMFVRPRDRERETWTGRRLGVEGAVAELGADDAHPTHEARERLRDLLDGATEVHYLLSDDGDLDRLVHAVVRDLREGERRGRRMPPRMVDLRLTLHEIRLHKDEEALAALRRAAAITAEAHLAAMRDARPGMHEYEVEALVDYTFRRRGGGGPGYGTIVGGGRNATILHYIDNRDPLRAGDLLLIDAGAEWGGFTADVTRTFPVSGRFSAAQRRFYEVVLRAQEECVALVRPGATVDGIHEHAVRRLTEGMVELGLLAGEPSDLISSGAYQRFYMHRTSHWLGMDVHDVGAYYPSGPSRPLAPGMVLTIEPALYVAEDAEGVPPELRGLGVRIEDDVLVTAEGSENLTAATPKTVAEVEAACRR